MKSDIKIYCEVRDLLMKAKTLTGNYAFDNQSKVILFADLDGSDRISCGSIDELAGFLRGVNYMKRRETD